MSSRKKRSCPSVGPPCVQHALATGAARILKPTKSLMVCGRLEMKWMQYGESSRPKLYGMVGTYFFLPEDLESHGYSAKTGVTVHAEIKRAIDKGPLSAKIVRRMDEDLRTQSDMRTKPSWSKLIWLGPSIAAIYAERDEMTQVTGIPHEVDHIDPVNHPRLCGLTVPWNLRVIPASENRRKSNKLISQ